jgi:hypothetical protein
MVKMEHPVGVVVVLFLALLDGESGRAGSMVGLLVPDTYIFYDMFFRGESHHM